MAGVVAGLAETVGIRVVAGITLELTGTSRAWLEVLDDSCSSRVRLIALSTLRKKGPFASIA